MSSWLIRISHALGISPEVMASLYFPTSRQYLWSDDIDVTADEEFLRLLAVKSGFDYEMLLGLTLVPYMAKGLSTNDSVCLIESLGRRSSVKTRRGLRFCPVCLREDRVAYFRRKWRLSFVTACPVHLCYLWDSCPQCGMAVNSHRSPDGLPYPSCHRCGFDLKRARVQHLREHEMKAVRYLCHVLDSGWANLGRSECDSLDFFPVLRQLIKIACYWGCNKGFLEEEKHVGAQPSKEIFFFANVSISEHHLVFASAVRLFEDFPRQLLAFLHAHKLSTAELTKHMGHSQFLHDVILNHESRPRSPSRTARQKRSRNQARELLQLHT